MKTHDIEVFVNSRNPKVKGRQYQQLMYGEDFGGMITSDVKIHGEVFLPMTSWATGKIQLRDVSIPFNTNIIGLTVTDLHSNICKIGDFELVKDFRIRRGVYVSGLVRIEDHENLNAKVIIGYDLKIYSRKHLTLTSYKKTQKQKDKSK